ncbi:DUF192 domain-containing protein [Evansella sp. LMS18]|uniref:DUF192 domain-containing protein n=1 Tax=Evansella sp. LMS18 TaxID=2924033 RepID=UPI0020D129E4|nr:DUF192 domain-containing protein [Evansella sp. LMS18]UTR12329.1 DUF192 domain-containing protein [Evansella sp. LMS18]
MKLVNLSNDRVIAGDVNKAYNFFKRLKGLMFTKELPAGEGLHIKPCPSIHTFFMKYPIDVLYINKDNVVVAIDEALQPGKAGARYPGASAVVELSVGSVKASETQVGHKLNFI